MRASGALRQVKIELMLAKQGITTWLQSNEAKAIFKQAADKLNAYKVKFEANKPYLEKAKDFLKKDLTERFHDDIKNTCPTHAFN